MNARIISILLSDSTCETEIICDAFADCDITLPDRLRTRSGQQWLQRYSRICPRLQPAEIARMADDRRWAEEEDVEFDWERDDAMGPPWTESEGHGMVSDWTSRGKQPGEWVLVQAGRSKRYYDAQETLKFALRDGWGEVREGETKRQRAARAVKEDFEFLRGWCDYEWSYQNLRATHPDGREAMCGGIEATDDYVQIIEAELAAELRAEGPVVGYVFAMGTDELIVERTRTEHAEFHKRYDRDAHQRPAQRATGIDVIDSRADDSQYWAVWVEDCFDPPVAIVQTDDHDAPSDAIDKFVDELDWAHMDESDAADYEPDELHYNSSGILYDMERMNMREVQLVRVVRAPESR